MTMRVLVIDDEVDMHRLFAIMLRREGATPITVGDGFSGEVIVKEVQVDLILLDIMMPGQDGWHTLKNLRAGGFAGRIVMISAAADEDFARRAKFEGADDFVSKAVLKKDLRSVLSAGAAQ